MASVTHTDTTRKGTRSCALLFLCFFYHRLPDLTAHASYNIYGGKNDLTTAFSDVQRFIRYVSELLSIVFARLLPSNPRWRVALMEHSIKLIDFETVDQMVQVHGTRCLPPTERPLILWTVDYEGVGLNSRTSNSKAAASEISSLFQNHYPEFLVRGPAFTLPIFFKTFHPRRASSSSTSLHS
jgi:hypothetical protein